jgi:hypothetical protein
MKMGCAIEVTPIHCNRTDCSHVDPVTPARGMGTISFERAGCVR